MCIKNIAIVAAKRTAIGTFSGTLKDIPAHQLGATVIKDLLKTTNISPEDINEVILGQILTAGCGQNPARQTALAAGLPHTSTAQTINRVCGSGLQAVIDGARAIACNAANIVIAGGQENMSQSRHTIHLRNGTRMGDANMADTMITDGLWCAMNDIHMGITAENVATQYKIGREMQDEFAFGSQSRAAKAIEAGEFETEIAPVTIPQRKGDSIIFDRDEHPRLTPAEKLANLRPAFTKDGTITAGNASGINDGAAAVLLMTAEEAEKRGLTPLALIKGSAIAGVDPTIMGTGPIPASQNALEDAGWTIDDLDLIEANEAFAAQAIAVNKGMKWDTEKVNVNGGAIALGHPIGASGARVLTTLLHAMQKRSAKKGLATLCIGGGQGIALCVERP